MSDVPGLDQLNHIRESLPTLSPHQRTAFAVACAERVVPVLEDYYGKRKTQARNAIDLAWRWALGEAIPESKLKKAIAACEALVDPLYENDEDGATLYALNAISYALQTTVQAEVKPAELAISNASDAAQTDDIKHGNDHIIEEANWQLLAFDVALKATEVRRDMFQQLPAPPNWLTDFWANRALERGPIP